MGHPFFSRFDRVSVINLPQRDDRRREMADELSGIGEQIGTGRIGFFEATRPQDQGPFGSVGARGCFLSHLAALKAARDAGAESFLLMEDDAHFGRAFEDNADAVAEALGHEDWDIFYAGHRPSEPIEGAGAVTEAPAQVSIMQAHAVAFRGAVIEKLVPYLEAMLARPAGSAEGGPMHVDGAYGWFRRAEPSFRTLIATPEIITQRASRSDITSRGWKDKVPLVGLVRRLRNRSR